MTLPLDTVRLYAYLAGFRDQALDTIVGIANKESGFNPAAANTAGNVAGKDRGILQINDYYHPEVTDSCAYDPACSFREAFRISNGGTDFTPWATYNAGLVPGGSTFPVSTSGFPGLPFTPPAFFGLVQALTGLFAKAGANISTAGDLAKTIGEIGTRFLDILRWITDPANWWRTGFIIVGIGAIVIGLNLYAEQALQKKIGPLIEAAAAAKGAAA